jgi:hypothetical protein
LLIVGLLWTGVSPASAQTPNVAEQVEALRIHLLTAQLQPDEATANLSRAAQIYQTALEESIAAAAPDVNAHILGAFDDARKALEAGNMVAYAAARAQNLDRSASRRVSNGDRGC